MAKPKDRFQTYEGRRDFRRSPEPRPDGEDAPRWRKDDNPIFVVQEHRASRHHFDFRLEVDGALASWAVPKGPSTDPSEKRLAVRTEDHPLSYADFEGVIPEDEYGGGTVIVWDAGPYRLLGDEEDAKQALDGGRIEVFLGGRKLRGGYALVHAKVGGKDENWLLVKMDDDDADARRNPTSTEPMSVLSGRTLDDVAAQEQEDGKEDGNGGADDD